jgi:hypothetical protein
MTRQEGVRQLQLKCPRTDVTGSVSVSAVEPDHPEKLISLGVSGHERSRDSSERAGRGLSGVRFGEGTAEVATNVV